MITREKWTFISIILLFGFLNLFAYYCKPFNNLLNSIILSITAIIIFWYTYETSQIRKANLIVSGYNKLLSEKSRKPMVSFAIISDPKEPKETGFIIKNLSDFPVAVRIKCNFKLDNVIIANIWPSYDGVEYWNLQYKDEKGGHFCWIDLLENGGYFTNQTAETLRREDRNGIINYFGMAIGPEGNGPKLTMDLEVYSFNEFKQDAYYPPVYYQFNFFRLNWIPKITSEKPIWEYDSKPTWANE